MISIERTGDILVVSFPEMAKLNVTVSQKVKQEVTKLIDQKGLKLIIDLAGVTYIDSSGFGTLLSILRCCKSGGAKLRIANTAPDVMELVKLLQLHTIFDFHGSVQEAIDSL